MLAERPFVQSGRNWFGEKMGKWPPEMTFAVDRCVEGSLTWTKFKVSAVAGFTRVHFPLIQSTISRLSEGKSVVSMVFLVLLLTWGHAQRRDAEANAPTHTSASPATLLAEFKNLRRLN